MTALIHALIDLPFVFAVVLKITLVLGLGWMTHFLLVHHNPRWRVLLWRCIMVGVCLVPALSPLKYMQIRVAPMPELPVTSTAHSISDYSVAPLTSALSEEPVPVRESLVGSHSQGPQSSFSLFTWLRERIWMIVFVLWGIIATILTSRLLVGYIHIRRTIENSLLAPEHLQSLLTRVASDLDCPRNAELRISSDLCTPFLAGLRRPAIVLPERMKGGEHAEESPAILAHEVAHLCSGDLFWMFIAKWISALLWFHPLIWKLQDTHSAACEEVCDAVAADYVGNAELYSSALARVALEIIGTDMAIGAIPLVRSSDILARLKMLKRNACSRPLARRWVLLSVLMGTAILMCLGGAKLVYAQEDRPSSESDTTLQESAEINMELTPEDDQLDEKIPDEGSEESSGKQESKLSEKIILKLVDPEGLPVSGAKVGTRVRTQDVAGLSSVLRWTLYSQDVNISDQQGEITLTREKLCPPFWPVGAKVFFYILHEKRRVGAIIEIPKGDKRQAIDLTLEPVCHVHGKLDSKDLKEVGRPLTWTRAYIFGAETMSHLSLDRRFEFFLPPGEYELCVSGGGEGTGVKNTKTKFEVKPDQLELDMGVIELPATKLSSLVGKLAPEIGPIKAWKNGSPVRLADLRGKVVLLQFGGDCPSTYHDLPRLVQMHKDLEKQGLVIIGLYSSSSMEALEKAWAENYEKHGGEPDVPFRIAIDGGESRLYEGTNKQRLGATYATYDIAAYPISILIDPEGKITGMLNPDNIRGKVETMLGRTVKPEFATWRQRFSKVYFLEEGQVLKRIPPPFIPEREEFYWKGQYSRPSQDRSPDYYVFHWDGELRQMSMGYIGGRSRSLRSALRASPGSLNRFEGPEELLKIKMPGDWIVRKGASEEQKLKALEGILANEIGRKTRFVKRTVKRRTIVATGSFKYDPVPGAQDDHSVHIFSGDFINESRGGGGSVDSVHDFLEVIGDRLETPIIDQTESATRIRVPHRVHYSASVWGMKDPVEKEEKVLEVLDNISQQTSLQFRIEPRPIEKWFVTEENPEK